MAKEGGKDQPDRFTDLDELLECINRRSLRPIRANEAPLSLWLLCRVLSGGI